MNETELRQLADSVCDGHKTTPTEAMDIVAAPSIPITSLLAAADHVRRAFKGTAITGCSVINVKSGACSENCSFCSQSVHNKTDINIYGMMNADRIVESFGRASECGAAACGLVASGRGLENDADIETICTAIRRAVKTHPSVRPHVSLGTLSSGTLQKMKASGLHGCHHNLETSRNHFPNVCTTHSYDERIATVRTAKEAGLWVCSGGLFGIGETWSDRVDLAMTLRELEVDSVPINFLNPIPGTRLESMPRLEPIECIKIIAMMRFVLPAADIRVCGGRENVMRDLQTMMFYAGANGTMLGDYLTTTGRPARQDIQMIEDLGLNLTGILGDGDDLAR